MILTGSVLLGLLLLALAGAAVLMFRLGLPFRQALLYLPVRVLYRVDDRRMRETRFVSPPVIYAISHQSRLDPALMLALLPPDTLHILDEASARSAWLEPWRALARTIAFNAEHVFVSRRLVRVLKGKGRLAVYLPGTVEPDVKTFRLTRAAARIAVKAQAAVVPIYIDGAGRRTRSPTDPGKAPWRVFPRLKISTLPPLTMAQLIEAAGQPITPSNALFDRIAEARLAAIDLQQGLFYALRDAADRFGRSRIIVEDVVSEPLSYRRLLISARVLGRRFAALSHPGEAVGILLPNASGLVVALYALLSGGRVAAMINYTSGPANVEAAVRAASVRTIVSSRAFIAKAKLEDIVDAAERSGATFLWIDDLKAQVTALEKAAAALFWRIPLHRQDGEKPAVILFTSGSEGLPKAVVLSHRNLLANVGQVEARIALSVEDKLLNVLPAFHSFGLTGGTILPLQAGVQLFLYPSPLHTKLIPQVAARTRPTILVGTDTFLSAYARTAKDEDFSSLRLVVAGAEPVKAETRRVWRERFGAEIVEGFGLTEAAPVVAVNSATHGREGSVGRLMPGMNLRLEPVEGIADAGRLWVQGPNVMMGYMTPDRPGELQPLADGWHDSGDIVSVDREGFLFIKGRAKRFAKIAGEMVSLGAVEMLVQALWPEERHAAVSVPDARKGERIVLVTTAENADPNALREFGRKSGAAELMVPNDIVKVPEIPVLGSGKTDYPAARKLALDELGLHA